MNLVWAALILLAAVAASVTVMLLVRRRAPAGSRFADGDRASGVFGVLATGFSVLVGFLIFLAFSSYDQARTGAETEATIVAQQVQTAQFMPRPTSDELTGELVCYARSVVGIEWNGLDSGAGANAINPWGAAMFHSMSQAHPETFAEQSAYGRWMDQTAQREQARVDRIHGAEGIVPLPLWLVLIVISLVIFVFMLFFADIAEAATTQGMLMGSVAAIITLLLLLLLFFDHPHGSGVGRLEPTAMTRTVHLIDAQLEVAGVKVDPPCAADGRPR